MPAHVIQLLKVNEDGTVHMLMWNVCAHKYESLINACNEVVGPPTEAFALSENGKITSTTHLEPEHG